MRLTNNQIFTRSMQDMSKSQQRLNTAHTQITSLNKYKTSADSPADVSKSTYLNDEINKNTQYQKNSLMLKSTLGLEEATLSNIHTAMERGRVLTIRALNGSVGELDLNAIATEINEVQKEIFNLVNTKNANGDHIFSGSASEVQSYTWDANKAQYNFQGNEQDNKIQIASNVFIRNGDNGREVFESAPARLIALSDNLVGNVSAAEVRIIDQGEYDNFHRDNYDYAMSANNIFKITVSPPTIPGNSDTYTITDSGNNVQQSGNFMSDNIIRFGGMAMSATGSSPGSVDIILAPSINENILNTLEAFKKVLTDTSITKSEFQDGIADAQLGIGNAKHAVMSVISSIGGRNNAIERITESNESFKLINQEAMAILTETDLAAAMTDLTKEQNILETSYKTFNKINNLSLFNAM